MDEINRLYPDTKSAAERKPASKEPVQAKERKNRERPQAQATFESGFDHGFESMATFNGREVGKEGGPLQTASVSVAEPKGEAALP
jgi:hypothetical protein